MKKTLEQSLGSSLMQYLRYRALVDLEAYHTVTGALVRYEDPKYDLIAYASPEAGWAFDKISGVIEPTIYGYDRGVNGMIAKDFINGRFLFSGDFPNIPLTGEYTVSEFNWYLSSQSESKIIFETKCEQPPVLNSPTGYIPPYNYIAPAVFVKPFETHNEPYALGSEIWSVYRYKIIGLMDNESYLVGLQSIIRDCYQEIFPLIQGFALNQYGDLSDSTWDYTQNLSEYDYYGFISDSTCKTEEPDVFISQNPNQFLLIGNIEVRIVRTPSIRGSDPDLSRTYALTDIEDIFDTDNEDNFILS